MYITHRRLHMRQTGQHTSAYISIHQHTSAYVSIHNAPPLADAPNGSAYVSIYITHRR